MKLLVHGKLDFLVFSSYLDRLKKKKKKKNKNKRNKNE